jgi:hypothetical protein
MEPGDTDAAITAMRQAGIRIVESAELLASG